MGQGQDKIAQNLIDLQPTAIIELFLLYFNEPDNENEFIAFHGGAVYEKGITWQGIKYLPIPVETEGFEVSADGKMVRPKIRVSNKDYFVTDLLIRNEDLQFAKIIRKRTFVKFLDDVNFDGGNPWGEADVTAELSNDTYVISQKTAENKNYVEFELTSPLDLENFEINNRIIMSKYCCWQYRGNGCNYMGPPIETEDEIGLELNQSIIDNWANNENFSWIENKDYSNGDAVYLENKKIKIAQNYIFGTPSGFAKIWYVCKKNHKSSQENKPSSSRQSEFWSRDGCPKKINSCKKRFQNSDKQILAIQNRAVLTNFIDFTIKGVEYNLNTISHLAEIDGPAFSYGSYYLPGNVANYKTGNESDKYLSWQKGPVQPIFDTEQMFSFKFLENFKIKKIQVSRVPNLLEHNSEQLIFKKNPNDSPIFVKDSISLNQNAAFKTIYGDAPDEDVKEVSEIQYVTFAKGINEILIYKDTNGLYFNDSLTDQIISSKDWQMSFFAQFPFGVGNYLQFGQDSILHNLSRGDSSFDGINLYVSKERDNNIYLNLDFKTIERSAPNASNSRSSAATTTVATAENLISYSEFFTDNSWIKTGINVKAFDSDFYNGKQIFAPGNVGNTSSPYTSNFATKIQELGNQEFVYDKTLTFTTTQSNSKNKLFHSEGFDQEYGTRPNNTRYWQNIIFPSTLDSDSKNTETIRGNGSEFLAPDDTYTATKLVAGTNVKIEEITSTNNATQYPVLVSEINWIPANSLWGSLTAPYGPHEDSNNNLVRQGEISNKAVETFASLGYNPNYVPTVVTTPSANAKLHQLHFPIVSPRSAEIETDTPDDIYEFLTDKDFTDVVENFNHLYFSIYLKVPLAGDQFVKIVIPKDLVFETTATTDSFCVFKINYSNSEKVTPVKYSLNQDIQEIEGSYEETTAANYVRLILRFKYKNTINLASFETIRLVLTNANGDDNIVINTNSSSNSSYSWWGAVFRVTPILGLTAYKIAVPRTSRHGIFQKSPGVFNNNQVLPSGYFSSELGDWIPNNTCHFFSIYAKKGTTAQFAIQIGAAYGTYYSSFAVMIVFDIEEKTGRVKQFGFDFNPFDIKVEDADNGWLLCSFKIKSSGLDGAAAGQLAIWLMEDNQLLFQGVEDSNGVNTYIYLWGAMLQKLDNESANPVPYLQKTLITPRHGIQKVINDSPNIGSASIFVSPGTQDKIILGVDSKNLQTPIDQKKYALFTLTGDGVAEWLDKSATRTNNEKNPIIKRYGNWYECSMSFDNTNINQPYYYNFYFIREINSENFWEYQGNTNFYSHIWGAQVSPKSIDNRLSLIKNEVPYENIIKNKSLKVLFNEKEINSIHIECLGGRANGITPTSYEGGRITLSVSNNNQSSSYLLGEEKGNEAFWSGEFFAMKNPNYKKQNPMYLCLNNWQFTSGYLPAANFAANEYDVTTNMKIGTMAIWTGDKYNIETRKNFFDGREFTQSNFFLNLDYKPTPKKYSEVVGSPELKDLFFWMEMDPLYINNNVSPKTISAANNNNIKLNFLNLNENISTYQTTQSIFSTTSKGFINQTPKNSLPFGGFPGTDKYE